MHLDLPDVAPVQPAGILHLMPVHVQTVQPASIQRHLVLVHVVRVLRACMLHLDPPDVAHVRPASTLHLMPVRVQRVKLVNIHPLVRESA